jgi:hypothetical protein
MLIEAQHDLDEIAGTISGSRAGAPVSSTSASLTSGEWNDDDYDVLADGVVVGRITPWMWTLAFGADALCDRLRLLTARVGWNTEDSRRVL